MFAGLMVAGFGRPRSLGAHGGQSRPMRQPERDVRALDVRLAQPAREEPEGLVRQPNQVTAHSAGSDVYAVDN